jgi:16S rRNA (cytosine967-C5)-methyltransferase
VDYLPESCWPTASNERLAAELSLPPWLAVRLSVERGEGIARRLSARLAIPAKVDLRVNLRRAPREKVREFLEEETKCNVSLTPWSPLGLRIEKRVNLNSTTPGRNGWIEVEDEGSQLMVLAAASSDCRTVIDACAGGGGKTLAFMDLLLKGCSKSDTSEPIQEPVVFACDVSRRRLTKLERRARKAGVRDRVSIHCVAPDGELPSDIPMADLVLVDAPCSGLGTLRRNPDVKIRYGPEDIALFHRAQLRILERYATKVHMGGNLVYVTCSILREENEAVAEAFSAAHPEFQQSRSEWSMRNLPPECSQGGYLHVDPLLTGTDGFFLAMWNRRQHGPGVSP